MNSTPRSLTCPACPEGQQEYVEQPGAAPLAPCPRGHGIYEQMAAADRAIGIEPSKRTMRLGRRSREREEPEDYA